MPGVNKARFLIQHEECEFKCGSNERCSSKEKWNHDDCQCGRKELNNWSLCKCDYLWNPNAFDCEYSNKTCKDEEYLNIKIGLCKERLSGELVLACKDDILNIIITRLNDQKVISEKILARLTQLYL